MACLPGIYKYCTWKRLYNLLDDGCSLITFFRAARGHDNTVLLVKDENNHVFGAFCTTLWELKYRFFGSGENLLFSFFDSD